MRGITKRILAPIAIAALLVLTGCAGSSGGGDTGDTSNGSGSNASEEPQAPAEPLDLTGTWKQTNSESPDSYHSAVIEGDTITVNWVNESDDSTALYWLGSYEAPTEAADSYSWTAGNVDEMSKAILASQDASKDFSYENGVLSYELTALGVTTTVELAKE